MNEPDLTNAVDAAARKRYTDWAEDEYLASEGPTYDDLPAWEKRQWRQEALEWIYPAAQLLYDQGYKQACIDQRPDGEY